MGGIHRLWGSLPRVFRDAKENQKASCNAPISYSIDRIQEGASLGGKGTLARTSTNAIRAQANQWKYRPLSEEARPNLASGDCIRATRRFSGGGTRRKGYGGAAGKKFLGRHDSRAAAAADEWKWFT